MGSQRSKIYRATALFVVLAAALMPSDAPAQFYTGNNLYSDCTEPRGTNLYYQRSARCISYVMGVADQWSLQREMSGGSSCIPSGVTTGQLRDIVTQYLTANPGNRHLSAAALVMLAISQSFTGCSR